MNRAMRWLAVVALVAASLTAVLQVMSVNEQYSANGAGPSSGLTGPFPVWMLYAGLPAMVSVTFALTAGVSVLGMVVAWADQRRGWLNAVVVVTLASILWPYALDFWRIVHPTLAPSSTSDAPGLSFTFQLTLFSIDASPLVPVVLVLIYSVVSRADTHAEIDNRLDADAALEITRTPL